MIRPKHFRSGTHDEVIFRHVVQGEYGPIDFRGKRVLDVGAHIGGFSVLAASSGASGVRAYEANEENFELLCRNCDGLPVDCCLAAVWRSDKDADLVWIPSEDQANTGGGGVVSRDLVGAFDGHGGVRRVASVRFDDVVLAHGPFDVCKFDCEGSEYPILFTSELFSRIPLLVGEYHPDARTPALLEHLRAAGYHVQDRPVHSGFGKFTASRRA